MHTLSLGHWGSLLIKKIVFSVLDIANCADVDNPAKSYGFDGIYYCCHESPKVKEYKCHISFLELHYVQQNVQNINYVVRKQKDIVWNHIKISYFINGIPWR